MSAAWSNVYSAKIIIDMISAQNLLAQFLLCPWEKHCGTFHACWSWQVVLNFSHISMKFQPDKNIFAFPEAGRGNCLPYD